jgi:hypothetical protein
LCVAAMILHDLAPSATAAKEIDLDGTSVPPVDLIPSVP